MFGFGIGKEYKNTDLDDLKNFCHEGSSLDRNLFVQKNGVNSSVVIIIKGIVCLRCKTSIEKALKRVKGVINVNVDLTQKQAVVTGIGMEAVGLLVEAVEDAGYTVVSYYGWEIRQ